MISILPEEISDSTYDDNMKLLGIADETDPSLIRIYVKSFEDKDDIADAITRYNDGTTKEQDVIHYTDVVALLMSSITGIISGISYLLIAFVGISLVVSSIMIGIITYISVLERTREIGILRAIGASKHNVRTVFNAETLLVGLTAGLIGIGVSVLLTIPINAIIHSLTSLETLRAHVPVKGAIVLIIISMVLTLISGLIPSRRCGKKGSCGGSQNRISYTIINISHLSFRSSNGFFFCTKRKTAHKALSFICQLYHYLKAYLMNV